MIWKNVIEQLIASGLSQAGIAKCLRDRGIEITQPTINRLKSGETPEPKHSVGEGLLALVKERHEPV